MAGKKYLFLDLETSGLEPVDGAVVLAIGAVLDRNTTKDSIQEFNMLITPTEAEWRKASPEALKVNGLNYTQLQSDGKPLAEVKDLFMDWLFTWKVNSGSTVYVGQNPNFDLKFLKYYFSELETFADFPFLEPLDVRDLYSILVSRRQMPYLKYRSGENISKALGVEPEPWPHDALQGAHAVKRNYDKLMGLGVRK